MSVNSLLCNHTRFKRAVYFTSKDHVSMVLTAKRTYPEGGSEDDVTTLQSKEHVVAYTITAEPFRMYFNTPLSYQDIKAIRMEKDLQLKDAKIRIEEESCIYEFDNIYIVFKLLNEKPKGNLNGELVSERLVDIPPDILQYLAGFNNPLDRYNLLPAGYGWDGVRTGLELSTARKVQQLIIGEHNWEGITDGLITKIQDATIYTPAGMLTLDWDEATLIDRSSFNGDIVGERNFESEVFIIGQNKTLSKLLSTDPEIRNFKLPEEFNRCIVIKTNMIKNTRQTYGVSIELYKYGNYT